MKRVFIGKQRVELYESIDEMPIVRYIEYNKYLLIESGVGSTLEDINRNIDRVSMYLNAQDRENGQKQLMLLKQNMYFVREGKTPEFLAFACLIYSINDEKVTDLSPDNLERIIDRFKHKLTPKGLRGILESIKKKVEEEMDESFPNLGNSAELKEFYGQLRQRTLLILRQIEEDIDLSKEIEVINKALMRGMNPDVFHGKESKEVKYQKEFEEMCFVLNQNINKEAKTMTVKEFYTAFDVMKKQQPKKPKKNGR